MKLSRRIIVSISIVLVVLFALWAIVFNQTSKRQIYRHIDLILTQQSDKIISRFMENDSLPRSLEGASGTMQFFIEKVSPEYAANHQTPVFQTDEEFIDDIQEDEIVREMTRVFQKQDINYELTLTTQVFAWNDTLDFALVSIISLAVVLLIAIILIVSLIIISNMKPIYRLTDWLRNRKANEAIPQPDSRIKAQEFKEIESAVLEASEKSRQVYEEQKRFIGHASHEIQTPIAICRNRLELLVDNTQLDETQLSEIQKTLDTLNYISRLNKSLLLISKIDNHQFKEETEINIQQIVNQTLDNLTEIYENLNIKVETIENEPITVKMDPTLASSLVTNLLKNAFVHNHPNGTISIKLKNNTLTIGNTGINEPLDENAVFQTFYKKGENTHSTGLGLAIAKAVCTEYGFEIRYQFVENQHIFSVKFK
jgi:signal transduction histidine kinase